MRYGSLCSGIEAASVAWEPLGWQPAWFAEIEPFPSAVLKHHWPKVPNHGDMTLLVGKILSGAVEAPDILVGGTPCQAFSVAGLRGRLQGFPSSHTQIPWRGKPAADCPDTLRYKAIGNSMAVPVMHWIGARIKGYLKGKS